MSQKRKYRLCLIILCFVSFSLFGQPNYPIDLLRKNILFYHLTKGPIPYLNNYDDDNYCINGYVKNGGWVYEIPEMCQKIELSTMNIDGIYYPDTAYKLLAVCKPNLAYYDSINGEITTISRDDLIYLYDDLYLIAYRQNNPRDVKFLSGRIFKDIIWSDFASGGYTIYNLQNYIKIKCYNLNIKAIDFYKKKGCKYYFSIKSVNSGTSELMAIFNRRKPNSIPIYIKGKKINYN